MIRLTVGISLAFVCTAALAVSSPRYEVVILPDQGQSHAVNNLGDVVYTHDTPGGGWIAAITNGKQTQLLGTLGGSRSVAFDINDRGQAVGWSDTGVGETTNAFLYSNGVMRNLGSLGGESTSALKINEAGTVIGSGYLANGNQRGFIYTESAGMVMLGTLGGESSAVYDIDEEGRVLGASQDASGEWRNFIYENGNMTALPVYGDFQLYGFAPEGGYYGTYYPGLGGLAYIVRDGIVTELPEIGGINAINAHGYMVGLDRDFSMGLLGTPDGQSHTLDEIVDEAGWTSFHPLDINNNGQIVALSCKVSAGCFWTRLDPVAEVPEPASYAMFGAGLVAVGWVASRRQRRTGA